MNENFGRPLKYKTKKKLEDAINKYFEECDKNEKPYTMSGLALSMGIDRRTLLNYSNKEDFFPAIKNARDKVEKYVEEKLFLGSNTAGVIFNLKNNFGWVDKQEVESKNINTEVSYEEFLRNTSDSDEY